MRIDFLSRKMCMVTGRWRFLSRSREREYSGVCGSRIRILWEEKKGSKKVKKSRFEVK
jgi:hypothetical protein